MDAHTAVQFAPGQMMTTAQVAGRLGVEGRTIIRWAVAGRLPPAFKVPGKNGTYLFDPQVVEMFARQAKWKAS